MTSLFDERPQTMPARRKPAPVRRWKLRDELGRFRRKPMAKYMAEYLRVVGRLQHQRRHP